MNLYLPGRCKPEDSHPLCLMSECPCPKHQFKMIRITLIKCPILPGIVPIDSGPPAASFTHNYIEHQMESGWKEKESGVFWKKFLLQDGKIK
jgi:hypothetical protein